MPNPKLMPEAFCNDGLKNDIPETRASGVAENAITYADGFPQITMTPVAAGGKPPSGKDMNGILHEISQHIVHLNKGNMYQFDTAFANKIGGYPKGSVLISDKLDALFLSLVNNNKTNFNTASYTGKWLKFASPVVNNLTTDDAESTLSAAMGKKLQDEKLGKEGSQEISGSTFTVGNRNYTGYRLWSASGNEGLIIESSGINTGHKFIVRRHNNGTFESGNVRSFSLPAIDGDYTLAPAGLLTNQDLNTLTVPGLYGQNSNSNAQTARNYPVVKAGSLLVMPSAYGVQQIYSVFDATDIYARNQNSGGWTAWQKTNVSPAEMQAAIAAIQPNKSDEINLDDTTKLATAKAVKTLNDKIDRATPAGEIAFFAGSAPPYGWLKANGAAVSRTAYRALFAAIGTTYGAGDGRSTFNLPDLRGEFVRGFDDGRNLDRGRALGSRQADEIKAHNHMMPAGEPGSPSSWHLAVYGVADGQPYTHVEDFTSATQSSVRHLVSSTGGSETRPRNIALLACIKV
ncbi:tail fiber protein [Neisseria sp. Dent CA1/247]|uniref:tail fiber protein n=1 Tax=Neisseria sp. Dent CA1/247 TaxID=2912675 RepID=UPI001FD2EA4C|nr:tail fiber protein [Neisseria sp. Dent CA1/247]UOO77914.1 tail fiber protein [Neisseria sp. Dent CA1/247]